MSKSKDSSTKSNNISTVVNDISSVPFASRVARVLVCLSKNINSITEISKSCQLNKSTVHRLLNTLEEPGFVIYDSINHLYYLGPLVTQLASQSKATHQYLITCAMEEMNRLYKTSEETVALTALMGLELISLHDIESGHSLKVHEKPPPDIPHKMPLMPLGSTQYVLLAQLSDSDLRIALASIKAEDAKSQNLDMELLLGQFHQIRQQGYSITYGSRIPGGVGVSVPIYNYICPVALSIIGPESRLILKASAMLDELKVSSSRLSDHVLEIFKYSK